MIIASFHSYGTFEVSKHWLKRDLIGYLSDSEHSLKIIVSIPQLPADDLFFNLAKANLISSSKNLLNLKVVVSLLKNDLKKFLE